MKRLLIAMRCWDLTTGDEKLPALPTPLAEGATTANAIVYETNFAAATAKRENFNERKNDAASSMYNACSIAVRIYIDDVFDPVVMW
jgi:hypothetical protein